MKQFLPRAGEGLPKMAIFVVWFGANDAAVPPSPQSVRSPSSSSSRSRSRAPLQLTHTPHAPQMTLERFKANLNTILDMLRLPSSPWYSPSTQLVLLTPPPVDDGTRNAELASRTPARVPDRDAERTRQFAEAVKEVGAQGKVPVVDVWGRIMQFARDNDGGKLDKYLSDGLHLTAEGYRIATAGASPSLSLSRSREARPDGLSLSCARRHLGAPVRRVPAPVLGQHGATLPPLDPLYPTRAALLDLSLSLALGYLCVCCNSRYMCIAYRARCEGEHERERLRRARSRAEREVWELQAGEFVSPCSFSTRRRPRSENGSREGKRARRTLSRRARSSPGQISRLVSPSNATSAPS